MDRLFSDFMGDFFPEKAGYSVPAVDVSESEKEVEIHAELPGISPDAVSVSADEETLTISGEKKVERESKEKNWHVTERSYGSFARVVQLPAPVDAGNAKAAFKDGVLTVVLSKKPEAVPRKVEIKVE